MVQLKELSCPNCGASLQVEAEKKICYCEHCGSKLILDDGSVTTRIIDDAKVREAEANEKIKIMESELELKKLEAEEKDKKNTYVMAIVMMLILIGMSIFLHLTQ